MQSLSQQNSCQKTQALNHILNQAEHISGQEACYYNILAGQSLKHPLLQAIARIKWQRIVLILFAFSVLAVHTTARAEQWFFSEPLLWDARFMFDGKWLNTEASPGNTWDSKELRYREQLSFKKRVHIMDPGIATFSFDVRPTLTQTDYTNTDNTSSESDSTAWNYAASSSFLHGTTIPVSLTAGIDRTTGVTDSTLGSHTNFDNKNQKATLNLKNYFFPSFISYTEREQELEQSSGFLATPSRINDKTRRWNYRGSNSKMSLNIEHLEYDDFIFDRHYTYDREHLNHTFAWGKNSYLRTHLEHVEQKDFGAYESVFINEDIRLQHTRQFFTTFRYNYNKTKKTFDRTSHQGYLDFNHELYSNLKTSVGYQKRVSIYSSGNQVETTGPRYSVDYNKKLPFRNSSIALGVNGTSLKQDMELIEAIDRPYTVTGPGDITLNEKYIDISTIVITDDTGSVLYTIGGGDYAITQIGAVTIINIPAATSIPFPSEIHIDYTYRIPANESRHHGHYIRLKLDNFQIYYSLSKSDQKLLKPANKSSHNRESTSGILYNLRRDQFSLRLGLEARNTELDQYWSRSRSFNQNLSYTFTPLTTLTVNADESSAETALSDTSSVSAGAGLKVMFPWYRISLRPHMSYWQRDDNIGNDDTFYSYGMDFDWYYHLITFNASFNNNNWSGTTRNSDEKRLMFTLMRRSR